MTDRKAEEMTGRKVGMTGERGEGADSELGGEEHHSFGLQHYHHLQHAWMMSPDLGKMFSGALGCDNCYQLRQKGYRRRLYRLKALGRRR